MKKNNFHLIFSHTLTQAQKDDAKDTFGADQFISLPKNLQQLWSNIDPEQGSLDKYLIPLWMYMKDNIKKDDIVLIQGDFGATCLAVKLAKELKATPVYATTKRVVAEQIKNNEVIKTSNFKHVRYRIYE